MLGEGCFNPAVAIGIDVSSAGLGFGWSAAYTGYEILGAALAAAAFRVIIVMMSSRENISARDLSS